MAQGLAFLFGASLSTQGPSLLADPTYVDSTLSVRILWYVFWVCITNNPATLRSCTFVQGEVTSLTSRNTPFQA